LKAEGVEWVSTFPPTVINNACGEEGVRNLMMRTERFAVAVADGYSRVSNGRRFGVCSAMGGINASGLHVAYAGIAQAYEDSTPLLCITDGVPPGIRGRERYDITQAFRDVTKWVGYIDKPERVPEMMRRAFTYLKSGRPGPVLVQLPRNLGEYDEEEHPYTPVKGWRYQGDPRDIEIAVRRLLSARLPIIYAGQGVFYADACRELLELAERLQAPVATTLKGKSCFPENHPLSLGVRGLPVERFMYKADVVLAVGCSLTPSHFEHHIPEGRAVIHCTIDEMALNQGASIDHAILGDVKLVLRQLLEEVERRGGDVRPREGLLEEIEDARREMRERYMPLLTSDERPINPYRVYWELMGVIDRENSCVTHDAGNTRDQMSAVYEALVPHGFIGWGNISTLGFSLGAAAGAKLAYPEREVVSVTGDAGVAYQLGDYEALLRNEIAVTTIHINNSAFAGYGPGFWGPGHHPYTAEVTSAEIVNMAKALDAMGIPTERVEEPDEVAPAIKRALRENRSGRPAYLEVICSQYPVYPSWIR